MHAKYAAIKEEQPSDLPDEIVGLGPNAGANLCCQPQGTRLIAIAPNVRSYPFRDADRRSGAWRCGSGKALAMMALAALIGSPTAAQTLDAAQRRADLDFLCDKIATRYA